MPDLLLVHRPGQRLHAEVVRATSRPLPVTGNATLCSASSNSVECRLHLWRCTSAHGRGSLSDFQPLFRAPRRATWAHRDERVQRRCQRAARARPVARDHAGSALTPTGGGVSELTAAVLGRALFSRLKREASTAKTTIAGTIMPASIMKYGPGLILS